MSNQTDRSEPVAGSPRKPSRRRWLRYSVAGALAAAIGGTALHAVADRGGRGGHGGRWGGHRGWCADDDDACRDKARKFMEQRIDFLMYKLDATPDQRAAVKAVLADAFADLSTLRETGRNGRQAVIAELAKPTLDRAALEALRVDHLSAADRASQRIVQAMADAAEILTPDQRARLPEIVAEFRGRRHH